LRADDAEERKSRRPAMTELLQAVTGPVEAKGNEQRCFGADADQPDPPREHPERPVLVAADEREHKLEDDHEDDRRGGFPA
jgi:hypothetical protein